MKKIVVLVSLLMLPIISQAACVRADLTGAWRVYVKSQVGVARCTAIMPATGTAISAGSVCTVPGKGNYGLSGNLTLNANCNVFGTTNMGGLVNYLDAWISRGKDSISGISWFAGNPLGGEVVSGSRQ